MKSYARLPSPAMIVAVVALIVALGGSAWAGMKIGTAQIKNKAVTPSKLAPSVDTLKGWVRIAPDGEIYSRSSAKAIKSATAGNQGSNFRNYCIDMGFEPKTAMVSDSGGGAFDSSVWAPVSEGFATITGCPPSTDAVAAVSGDFTNPNNYIFLQTTVWFR